MVLSSDQILSHRPRLIENEFQPHNQYQQCGVDLTVKDVSEFGSPGVLSVDGKELPYTYSIGASSGHYPDTVWDLDQGAYLIDFYEVINLPLDLMAYLLPRSTLLRCGVSLHTAVWDPGYNGVGQALLTVHNPYGFSVQQGARVAQMVFHQLSEAATDGYDGSYQGVGLETE